MAIYQFNLEVIPKIGLQKKYGVIPEKMEVSIETGCFESSTDEYWKLSNITFEEIKQDIDKIIDVANWGNDEECFNWKTYTDELDNDAWMLIDTATKKVVELSFRADLRENNLTFLQEMVNLARKYDLLFIDRKGNLVKPELDELKKYIKASNSYKFLENPTQFLKDLQERKIPLE